MRSIIILHKDQIFVPFWGDNLLENLDIIGLNESSLFVSAYIEVESVFKVSTNNYKDVNDLIFSFELILDLRELFSIILIIATMNKDLSL